MKKLSLLIIFAIAIVPFQAFSQDYETIATQAYGSGRYAEAIVQYEAALAYLKSRRVAESDRKYSEIQRQVVRAKKCEPLMTQAENLFAQAKTADDFIGAKDAYCQVLAINETDSLSISRVQTCDAQLQRIAMIQAEAEMWAEMTQGPNGKEVYEKYVAEFPEGAHIEEVKSILRKIVDEELWATTLQANTKEAYAQYLSNPETSIHDSEAKAAIAKIDVTRKIERGIAQIASMRKSADGKFNSASEDLLFELLRLAPKDSRLLALRNEWINQ